MLLPNGQEKLSQKPFFKNVNIYYEFEDKVLRKFAHYLWIDSDLIKNIKQIYIEKDNGKVFILVNDNIMAYNNPEEFFLIKLRAE